MSINKEDKRVQGWDITRIRDWDEVKKKKKLYIYISFEKETEKKYTWYGWKIRSQSQKVKSLRKKELFLK